MHLLNYLFLGIGAVMLVSAFIRARPPWRRYQELKHQADNVARYEAWRGGVRDDKPSGAAMVIDNARRAIILSFLIGLIGLGLLLAGLYPA